jgi:hypothetical protein
MDGIGAGGARGRDDRIDVEEIDRPVTNRPRLDRDDAESIGGAPDAIGDLAAIRDEQARNRTAGGRLLGESACGPRCLWVDRRRWLLGIHERV